MYNTDHLQTFRLSGKDYYMEVDAMDKVHFYPKKNKSEKPGKHLDLNSIEESLFNFNDAFIDKSIEMNLKLNNRYFLVHHHYYSGIKVSVFNKKEDGKLSSISLLFINNKRKLIFDNIDEPLILFKLSELIKGSKSYSLSKKEKLLNDLLSEFSI